MVPNFKHPFSAFTHADYNPASFIIAQHYESVEGAVNYLVDLYFDDVDINDPDILKEVLERYGLDDDGFELEITNFVNMVNRELRRRSSMPLS